MNNRELRELLEKLRGEMEKTPSIDARDRELLRSLDADIHKLIERSEETSHETVVDRLQEAIEQMEVSHPDLTSTLSQLLTILSNAGI